MPPSSLAGSATEPTSQHVSVTPAPSVPGHTSWDAPFVRLQRNTGQQWPQPGATFEKPNSGHTGTISTTVRVG
jgi:hypothetical protein